MILLEMRENGVILRVELQNVDFDSQQHNFRWYKRVGKLKTYIHLARYECGTFRAFLRLNFTQLKTV